MADKMQQHAKGNNNEKKKGGPRNKNPRSHSKPRMNLDSFSELSIGSSSGNVQNSMLQALECPVCHDPMIAEIFLCETGHSICKACSLKLIPPICPLCNQKITLQRNFAFEQMAKTMMVPCVNNQFGCKFNALPEAIPSHFESCLFRQVLCPLGNIMNTCAWNGNYNQLMSHMKQNHSENVSFAFDKEVSLDKSILSTAYSDIKVMNKNVTLFLFHVHIDVYEKIAYFALQYYGCKQEANKWKYTMIVYLKSDTAKKIEISEMCMSDKTEVKEIFKTGRCVAIPLLVLKNFVNPRDGKIMFKINANSHKKE